MSFERPQSNQPEQSPDNDRELLSAYLDEQIDSGERAYLEQRLTSDAALRSELEELRATTALLRGLPELTPPRSFTLDAAQVRPRGLAGWLRGANLRFAGALAVLVLALTLTTLLVAGPQGGAMVAMQPAGSAQEAAEALPNAEAAREGAPLAAEAEPETARTQAEPVAPASESTSAATAPAEVAAAPAEEAAEAPAAEAAEEPAAAPPDAAPMPQATPAPAGTPAAPMAGSTDSASLTMSATEESAGATSADEAVPQAAPAATSAAAATPVPAAPPTSGGPAPALLGAILVIVVLAGATAVWLLRRRSEP